MLHVSWMVVLFDHSMKNQIPKTIIHQASISGSSHFASWTLALRGPRQSYRLQKTSFRTLVGTYCHNIPTHPLQTVLRYYGVTEVAKPANIAKMAGS